MLRTIPTYHRSRAGKRGLPAAAALGTLVALALPVAPAAGAAQATLEIEGAGNGHGVGMSQDGALGYARHGASYQAILAHYYAGTTIGLAPPRATIRVLVGKKVLKIELESYVRGVIAAEMPASWPAAALEAQAVASRTYALTAHAGGSRFDVYSDTRSQVYEGAAAETPQTNAAVAATAGQIVLYRGHPATTYFFASSGGMTENIENAWPGSQPEPWLRGVADPYDGVIPARWTSSMSWSTAAARLRGLYKGSLRGIEVLKRGVSPRIVSALVMGSAGSTQVTGPELAARFLLPSTWAYFLVKRGGAVTREPDVSDRPAALPSEPAAAPAPPGSQGGGAAAPGAPAQTARGGGTSAE
jgi:stage II sporulation protein D